MLNLKLPPPTERLRFRAMTHGDVDELFEMLGDPDVMRHYPFVMSHRDSQIWLEKSLARYKDDGHCFYLCESLETGEVVGQVGILAQDVNGTPEKEVGYLLKKRFWHQGYATEAARACRDYARSGFGYDRIISLIRPDNIPSQNVAKRLGGVLEENVMWRDFMHGIWVLGR